MTSKRRQYSAEFKERVLAESQRHGASIAGVALAHGLNTNLLHKWRRQRASVTGETPQTTLVPVTVAPEPIAVAAPSAEPCDGTIEIELPRAKLTVRGRIDFDTLQAVLAALRPR